MGIFISEGVKILAKQMIEHPEDWRQGMYHFSNKTHNDISIWTANGWPFLKLNGNEAFNVFEKLYLNAVIKKSIALKVRGVITND